jgi:hypothetical protein
MPQTTPQEVAELLALTLESIQEREDHWMIVAERNI